MAMYLKGDAIAFTELYALYKKIDNIYECVATAPANANGNVEPYNGIFFNLDTYKDSLDVGTNTLVVKATGNGNPYKDSVYSDEVTYTVSNIDLDNKCVMKFYVDSYGDIDIDYVKNGTNISVRAFENETTVIAADWGSVFTLTHLNGESIYFGSMYQFEEVTTDKTNSDDIIAFRVPSTSTHSLSFDHS